MCLGARVTSCCLCASASFRGFAVRVAVLAQLVHPESSGRARRHARGAVECRLACLAAVRARPVAPTARRALRVAALAHAIVVDVLVRRTRECGLAGLVRRGFFPRRARFDARAAVFDVGALPTVRRPGGGAALNDRALAVAHLTGGPRPKVHRRAL